MNIKEGDDTLREKPNCRAVRAYNGESINAIIECEYLAIIL